MARLEKVVAAAVKLLFAIVLVMAWIDTAGAQIICGERQQIIADLKGKYDEQQVGVGIDRAGKMVEVWASHDGSYTILVTEPGQRTCLVSTGEGWQVQALKAPSL